VKIPRRREKVSQAQARLRRGSTRSAVAARHHRRNGEKLLAYSVVFSRIAVRMKTHLRGARRFCPESCWSQSRERCAVGVRRCLRRGARILLCQASASALDGARCLANKNGVPVLLDYAPSQLRLGRSTTAVIALAMHARVTAKCASAPGQHAAFCRRAGARPARRT